MSYPKMMYHPTLGATVVNTPEETIALSNEWADTPFTDTCAIVPSMTRFDDLPATAKAPGGEAPIADVAADWVPDSGTIVPEVRRRGRPPKQQ